MVDDEEVFGGSVEGVGVPRGWGVVGKASGPQATKQVLVVHRGLA
jgi:hypothetical protein